MSEEVWKDITGYDGRYKVSNLGRIASHQKGKEVLIRKLTPAPSGYLKIILGIKPMYIHRVVVETFIGEIPKGYHVHHINGEKHDNRLENLGVVTPKENVRHAASLGLMSIRYHISREDSIEIKRLAESREMILSEIADRYRVSEAVVIRIRDGKRWSSQ